MKKFIVLSLLMVFSTSCISLFSEIEIHESGNQHHSSSAHSEELEHRINELEEKVHYLMELLEEREDDHEEEEEHDEEEEREEDED